MNGEVQEELAVKCNNLKDELPKTREKFRKLQLRVISITMFSFPLSVARPPLTGLRDYTQTHHTRQDSSGRMISPTQKPLPDNTQHSQHSSISRRNSDPQDQQASGRRPTPSTARPPGSTSYYIYGYKP